MKEKNAPGTAPHIAQELELREEPAPIAVSFQQPLQPRSMRLSSGGASSPLYSRRFPDIRGGQCEYCGVIDQNQPAHYQYKLCPHYRGMEMRCVYHNEGAGFAGHDDVIRQSTLHIFEHPFRPGELVSHCKAYECSRRFEDEFHLTNR